MEEKLNKVLRKYGEREGNERWQYVFDDWNVPTMEMHLEKGIEYVPIYSVIYDHKEMSVMYGDFYHDGDICEADIYSLVHLEELIQLIIDLEEGQ